MTRISERQLHAQCVQWVRAQYPYLLVHHSPNEGKRGWRSQRDVKDLGVLAGWPDLQIIYPRGQTIYFELKAVGGRLSDAQKSCHFRLRQCQQIVYICHDLDEFRRCVEMHIDFEEAMQNDRDHP